MNASPRERLLTRPLSLALVLVLAVVGWAVATRHPSPDLDGAIEWLADGDLDGDERERMLRRVLELAPGAASLRHRWAGVLAAVAVQDAAAFATLEPRLGEAAARVLPAADRHWLDLGDPLLGNVLAAMSHDAAGERPDAERRWRQVVEQARLTHQTFAGELAAAALAGPK